MSDSDEQGVECVQPVIQVPVVNKPREHNSSTETVSFSDINPVPVQVSVNMTQSTPVVTTEVPSTSAGQKPEVVKLKSSNSGGAKVRNSKQQSSEPVCQCIAAVPVVSEDDSEHSGALTEQVSMDATGIGVEMANVQDMEATEQGEAIQIETVNEKGEKVLVQHYLLTSITTNTSTGKQTNQLITTPIVLPAKPEVSADGIAVPLHLLINQASKGSELQVQSEQSVGEGEEIFTSADQLVEQAPDNSNSLMVETLDTINTISEMAQTESGNMEYAKVVDTSFVNDPLQDKINITFIQRNETDDDDDSIQVSAGQNLEYAMGSLMETGAPILHCSTETVMDPHCADNCADYSGIVDSNKEYLLCNPVVDDLEFHEDMDRIQPTCSEPEGDVLSMAASKELSDTLSSI